MPLAILSTHSYTAEGGTIRGELVIAEHMTMTQPRLGDRVLLVDDMVDSAIRSAAVHDELPQRFPHITDLRTAVLWWKACSMFKPDYYVDYLAGQPVDPPAVRGLRQPRSGGTRRSGSRVTRTGEPGPVGRTAEPLARAFDIAARRAGTPHARGRKQQRPPARALRVIIWWCPEEDSNLHSVATART